MKKPQIVPQFRSRSKMTWKFSEFTDGEINTDPSQTIPDESYTIKEILERFTRGFPPVTKQGIYLDQEENLPNEFLGDEDLEKFNNLDFAEQREIMDYLKDKIRIQSEIVEQEEREPKLAPKDAPTTDEKS